MKILIFEWGAYTQPDINSCFTKHNIQFCSFRYRFDDKNFDPYFCRHFASCLAADKYDAVFSVNFFPLVADVCQNQNVKYLSWSYDNPLNVPDIERTLGYDTNYVFLFDRIQAAQYQNKGYSNVFHLPLGVNKERLSAITLTKAEHQLYSSDVSFIGKLYPSTFHEILAMLDEYNKGFLEGIANVQSGLYGYYVVDELLTDEVLNRINSSIQKKIAEYNPQSNFAISREQLSYSIATNITREERLILLNMLSKRHQLNLYSYENHPLLASASYLGTADYFTQMPRVFKASKINLNITLKILQSGIPLRALDVLSAGGFLLSNYQPEIAEHFIDGKEVVMYTDLQDAVAKTDYYLKHDDLRKKITEAGQAKVYEEFNYTKQLTQLFTTAGIL